MLTKDCACGCGTEVAHGKRFRQGHWSRTNREAIGAAKRGSGRGTRADGYVVLRSPLSDQRLEHMVVAEKAFGRLLPKGVRVHHVDHDRSNNAPTNLVICPNEKYHQLLHRRERALDACGHAEWRVCTYCKTYDDPAGMYVRPSGKQAWHRQCARGRPC